MSKKRDSAYLEGRLKRDFPREFADLRAKKFKNVSQAAAAAGLIRLPTRFDALKREWKGATPVQRAAFLTWVRATRIGLTSATRIKPPIVDAGRYLKPDVITVIRKWLAANHAKISDIVKGMGLSTLDGSLALALKGHYRLRKDAIVKLESWLKLQGL
jgi:hypothetical protein